MAVVCRLEQDVGGEVENVRIDGRENYRLRTVEAVFARGNDPGTDILHLAGAGVELGELTAVQYVGMQRVGRDIAVLFDANRMPVAEGDGAVVAAAGDADRAALLLRPINPVRKLIVRGHAVNLRRRLVVPGTPGLAAIHRDYRTLVGGEEHDVWIIGIDPGRVAVVSPGRALDGGQILAAVGGFVGGGIAEKYRVAIFWVDANPGKVGVASRHAAFFVHHGAALSGVV